MEGIATIAAAIALFLVGVFFKDKIARGEQARARTDNAQRTASAASRKAKERYNVRMEKAKQKAKTAVDSRPITNSPVNDLSERLLRNADRIRRRKRSRSGNND